MNLLFQSISSGQWTLDYRVFFCYKHVIILSFRGLIQLGEKYMNRLWSLLVLVVFPAVILAQTGSSQYPGSGGNPSPYKPAVPAPSIINGYGGWSSYYGGTTAAGSAMNGMASVISAKGNYNLSTSAAAINMTQAQKNEIQNRQQFTDTYFAMRATNRAARKAEEGTSPPTMEQIARMARDGAPKPFTSSDMDPVTGKPYWPSLLQQDSFALRRAELEELLTKQATYGSLGFWDQMQARQTIESMVEDLKSQIKDVQSQDYIASKAFLRSMIYAISKSDLS
jgi:hypothetical protein